MMYCGGGRVIGRSNPWPFGPESFVLVLFTPESIIHCRRLHPLGIQTTAGDHHVLSWTLLSNGDDALCCHKLRVRDTWDESEGLLQAEGSPRRMVGS